MKKYDLILAAAVVIAAAFLLIFQFLRQDDGRHYVEITVDGEVFWHIRPYRGSDS